MPRPAYSSTNTATTMLSATSCASGSASEYASTTYDSTALTTPDLASPKKGLFGGGAFEPMLHVTASPRIHDLARERSRSPIMENRKGQEEERYSTTPRRASLDVSRGPSVRDRAKEFESSSSSAAAPSPTRTPRPLPSPLQSRYASSSTTTPLRINKAPTALSSATKSTTRRVPVPSGIGSSFQLPKEEDQRTLGLGTPARSTSKGSTKKMIQQWESLPTTPAGPTNISSQMGNRVLSRDYLDHKPLPIPSATPVASTSAPYTPSKQYSTTYQASPSRTTSYAPSPLNQYHLQTPDAGPSSRKRQSVSPSTSAYSLSPSGEKRRKGKSPLKDILNVFGGGIQAIGRKAKGKSKGMPRYGSRDTLASQHDSLWSDPMDRIGSNGLPGGIVYSDRMGDKEMVRRSSDPTVIRGSAIVYLIPTPCSSVSSWGSWLTSWAILTPGNLKVTYCPVFQDPKSGHSTPKRVFSGTGPNQTTSGPAVSFSSIPPPELGSSPDVELDMMSCVEVRSLRKEEVKGRGIPTVPEGVGTEVLEMVWGDGTKRYIGVEGVGGRLGWVSAIWDVLLANKPEQMRDLPPPSPQMTQDIPLQAAPMSKESYDFPETTPGASSYHSQQGQSDLQRRISEYETKTAASSAPPVQKIGDTWVAASAVGRASGSEVSLRPLPAEGKDLRDSVQRMFDQGPDVATPAAGGPSRSDSEATARIKAWQPVTERELSIFSRTGSKRSQPLPEVVEYKPDTVLSFDPNDLNPSRSASQVRRNPTVVADSSTAAARRRGGNLTVVEEGDDSMTEAMRAPLTHISHVTFPKPTVTTALNIPHRLLTPIPSESYASSSESGGSTAMVTPRTAQSSLTVHTLNESVLDKLSVHSSEHTLLAKQVDGVHNNVQTAVTSLAALVAQSQIMSDPMKAPVPKALEDRLTSLGLDLKGLENALQLSTLASSRQATATAEEPKLVDIHAKLDSITKTCEDILAKHQVSQPVKGQDDITGHASPPTANSLLNKSPVPSNPSDVKPAARPQPQKRAGLNLVTDPNDEKQAGEEVAQIMTQLTGGSNKASPRLGGLQVLHNSATSAPSSPKAASGESSVALPEVVKEQVTEVLTLVRDLKEGRAMQTQQTTDIARYLNELNTWLEKFVQNSSKDITEMSTRLKTLAGEPATEDKASIPGLPDLVADVHSMMSEQKRRNDEEGMMGQRVDNLLKMMGDERERTAGQQSTIEHVLSVIESHRQANENVLRSLAIDLTNEIRGERIRFVEAMQQATTVNVNFHIEEFKKVLATEVNKAMGELGHVRAEKQALEQQISDLFALKAKHAPGSSRKNTRRAPAPPAQQAQAQGPPQPSPGPQTRGLPAPPR